MFGLLLCSMKAQAVEVGLIMSKRVYALTCENLKNTLYPAYKCNSNAMNPLGFTLLFGEGQMWNSNFINMYLDPRKGIGMDKMKKKCRSVFHTFIQ